MKHTCACFTAWQFRELQGNPLSVRLRSPDSAGERTLPVGAELRSPAFLVPELKTYAVVVIEGASLR